MKYLLLSALFAVASLGFAPLANAQQQINNDGAAGGDLQQYKNGSSLQNAPSGQQTSPVDQNSGAKALQNAPNAPLVVTGAPQPIVPVKNQSVIGWVVLATALFFVLMSPALIYARSASNKEQSQPKQPKTSPKPKSKEVPVATTPAKTEDTLAVQETKQATKNVTTKKKHKKSANKVKRGKKKK